MAQMVQENLPKLPSYCPYCHNCGKQTVRRDRCNPSLALCGRCGRTWVYDAKIGMWITR